MNDIRPINTSEGDVALPQMGTESSPLSEVERKQATDSRLINQLRRVTSSGRFIPEIDGLRFIAIMSVILYHLNGYLWVKNPDAFVISPATELLNRVLNIGHIGVPLFFVVSGFILALPFASHSLQGKEPISLRAYYLRRLTRLEPPYLISLLLLFVLLVITKGGASELFPHFLASAAYLHNIIYSDGSSINYVAWSLEVEVQFYLMAPFLALLFKVRSTVTRRALMIGIVCFLVFLLDIWPIEDRGRARLSLLSFGQFFMIGFLFADLYLSNPDKYDSRRQKGEILWDIISLIGWPLLLVLVVQGYYVHWLLPFYILLLYVAAFRSKWFRRLLSMPWITVIGGMCYSIYLLHFQIISAVGRITSKVQIENSYPLTLLLQCVLMTPVVIISSSVFYMLIEKPCMRRDWPARLINCLRRN